MRWLVVLPFERPEHMGVDFRDELVAMGHEVRTFAYRRNNPLYKNRGTKAAYQLWILRRLARISFVGSRYPYRERLIKELLAFPIKLWGAGWARTESLEIRALVAGGPVWGRAKLAIYSGSTLSLNHHHPMNDIVGVNTRAFELA